MPRQHITLSKSWIIPLREIPKYNLPPKPMNQSSEEASTQDNNTHFNYTGANRKELPKVLLYQLSCQGQVSIQESYTQHNITISKAREGITGLVQQSTPSPLTRYTKTIYLEGCMAWIPYTSCFFMVIQRGGDVLTCNGLHKSRGHAPQLP